MNMKILGQVHAVKNTVKINLLINQVHENNAETKLDLRFLVFVNIYGVINEINFEGLRF